MTEACGHNFCHACLLQFINGQNGRGPDGDISEESRSEITKFPPTGQNEWLCPECRSVQTKQPEELMRNRLVERAVESFNASSLQNPASNLCSHHNLELTLCKLRISYLILLAVEDRQKLKLLDCDFRLCKTSKKAMLQMQL